MMNSKICELLDIEFPLVAFTHCRDVVVAVSKAGGCGVLGAVGMSPEQLEKELKWIDDHIDGHPELKQDRDLLESIPGVGPKVSVRLMATLRSRLFDSARQAAAFVGLVPVPHESGSSVRGRPRLSKAGAPALRRRLYMAAVVSLRYNPDIAAQYHRLTARGQPKMSALAAAMRKLEQKHN